MKEMTLENIAQACKGQLFLPASVSKDKYITGVVLDSRKVEEGTLFLATVGERADGHQFIGSVFEKGASVVVTEKTPEEVQQEHGVPVKDWGAYILVPDSFIALKEIGEYYRMKFQIPVIGITGSVGKTSTKEFIAEVLSQKYCVLKTEGNYNNEIGVPLTLLRLREEHEAAVIEMGISDFGEMRRLSKMVRPDICVMTNIGQSHLETLKSRDGILKAKSEIFEYMAPDGVVCFNGEDDKLRSIEEVKGKKPFFFGMETEMASKVYATNIVNKGLFGSEVDLHIEKEDAVSVQIPLPGEHMVLNAACAACVGNILGLTKEEIKAGVEQVKPVDGRSHIIRLAHCVVLDDCYNANPISMKAAIDMLGNTETKKVAILGDMFDLGENSDAMHREIGEYCAEAGIQHMICIGENALHMYQSIEKKKTASQSAVYYQSKQEFLDGLKEKWMETFQDAAILVKASNGMGFSEIVQNISLYF